MCRDAWAGAQLAALGQAREHQTLRLGLADGRTVEIDRTPLTDTGVVLGALWQFRKVTTVAAPRHARHDEPDDDVVPAPATHRPNPALTTMSRELRAPLTRVANSAELMLADSRAGYLSKAQRAAVEVITGNARRLLGMVDNLHLLSQLEHRQVLLRHVDIRVQELVEKTTNAWQPAAARAGITLTCRAGHGPPLIGDLRCLRQVLDNLIHNALTFNRRPNSRVSVSALHSDTWWTFEIADHGIGIPDPELGLVTRAFVRGSNAVTTGTRGSGLGLTICRNLVELHGGSLTIESTVHVGTTVRVMLPNRRRRSSTTSISGTLSWPRA
jgi:signal transduction histidine kinase